MRQTTAAGNASPWLPALCGALLLAALPAAVAEVAVHQRSMPSAAYSALYEALPTHIVAGDQVVSQGPMPRSRAPPPADVHANRRLNSVAANANPAAKRVSAQLRLTLRAASAVTAGDANEQHGASAQTAAAAGTAMTQQLPMLTAGLIDTRDHSRHATLLTAANTTAAAIPASAMRRPASFSRRMLADDADGADHAATKAAADAPVMPVADLSDTLPARADGTIQLRLRLFADYGQTNDTLQGLVRVGPGERCPQHGTSIVQEKAKLRHDDLKSFCLRLILGCVAYFGATKIGLHLNGLERRCREGAATAEHSEQPAPP